MRLLLDSEDQVTWDHVRNLFCFSFKDNFISILHPLFNLNVQSLDIIYDFSSLAMRAVLGCNLSPAAASVAMSLHLHLHAKSNLNLLHDNALPIAFWTLLSFSILCTSASAFGAVDISCNRHVAACS
jgi:hypothetical protein